MRYVYYCYQISALRDPTCTTLTAHTGCWWIIFSLQHVLYNTIFYNSRQQQTKENCWAYKLNDNSRTNNRHIFRDNLSFYNGTYKCHVSRFECNIIVLLFKQILKNELAILIYVFETTWYSERIDNFDNKLWCDDVKLKIIYDTLVKSLWSKIDWSSDAPKMRAWRIVDKRMLEKWNICMLQFWQDVLKIHVRLHR